ncbi:glycosyltransferase family 4 protein [Allobranchiibius sp. CTAmp26]|uniref:glycosyltransferase family 4 protein n=1 Tax=Allobranchiibius sp. CTAmp26 TaxID=2815214 RepID=UPI0027DC68D6|nr:glycosyltransferase family 4 protein [Allobranchiibius sp. CTAmp26]
MKVALLSDCYLPRLGGIEVQVHDLARHLQAAGHEVEVFTATIGPEHLRIGTDWLDGIPVHRLAITLPKDFPINPFAPRTLRHMLQAGRFDVGHAHMGIVSPFAMDCVRVTQGLGLPTAVTWHSVHGNSTDWIGATGYVRRWGARGAALSAVSTVAAAPIQRMAGPGYPVHLMPNGIQASDWEPGAREDDGVLRVVSAMRLVWRKRPLALLELMEEVRRRVPERDVRLEILGDGKLRPRLEQRVAELGAGDWFSAPGRMTREQLREHYLASDVYISPGTFEAFGIAALEARTTGLPVVAPRRSGVSTFIEHGVNGLLAGDDLAMVEALVRLATDDRLRHRITEHNTAHPPIESWPSVVELVIAEYQRAQELERRRRAMALTGS